MTTSNDFRRGMVIKYNNDLFSVVEFLHVKPGKGGAFVRTKLKSVTKGSIIPVTFRGSENVQEVRLEKRPVQFLYKEGDDYVFMDNKSFEQYTITASKVSDSLKFVKEGSDLEITFHDEDALFADPPIFSELEVTHTEPGLKGDTATNVTKPAKLETGAEINVPIFINVGDKIKIDTRTGQYSERVKE